MYLFLWSNKEKTFDMKSRIKRHLNIENLILTVLEGHKKRWYSLSEVARETGLQAAHIFRVINESNKFVSADDHMQLPIISSRERFRKEEPFLRKLIGAFKNRIL